MDSQTLGATIASAQAGSAEAYQRLLEAYAPRLYGFFLRATGDHHEAEDLLGETMLRLVRQLGRYEERGRFDAWLFRMAANLVRDRLRRRRVGPLTLSLSRRDETHGGLAERLEADSPGVEAGMLAAEARTQLNEALMRLDESTREMILLRHFGEMSFKEIASVTEAPLGTVLAKVHRGLRALRRFMERYNEPG